MLRLCDFFLLVLNIYYPETKSPLLGLLFGHDILWKKCLFPKINIFEIKFRAQKAYFRILDINDINQGQKCIHDFFIHF